MCDKKKCDEKRVTDMTKIQKSSALHALGLKMCQLQLNVKFILYLK